MKMRSALVGLLVAAAPLAAQVTDSNIAQYGLGKVHAYEQTGPSTVTATSYAFDVFVDAASGGTINGAKVFGPLGSYLDTNGPQTLTVRGANDGADFNVKGFVSQTALDATGTGFPNDNSGNYKLQIDTGTTGGSVGGGYDHEIKFNLGAMPTRRPCRLSP